LRLFFPIEERIVYNQGVKFVVDNLRIAKTINVSKTAFQCIGIGVLTGLVFVSVGEFKKKKEKKSDQEI
jgi:hypothetical protein